MDASTTVRNFLLELRTEPLSASDLARYFGMSRNVIKSELLPTLDAVQVGNKYRVKLSQMPLVYFRSLDELHRIAQNCTRIESASDTSVAAN